VWALSAIRNFPVYFFARLGLLGDRTIVLRMRNGIDYFVRTGTGEPQLVEELWNRKVYDPLLPFINDGSTVIDIGGNIGIFSIKAARYAKGVRVVAYEPVAGNFAMLKKNIAANKEESRIDAYQLAVAGHPGELELYYEDSDTGRGSFAPHHQPDTKTVRVRCTTLADIFKDEHIEQCDFLKIDCEGAEEDILFNAPKELFSRIKSMTIEWHDNLSEHGFERFKEFLEEAGYRVSFDVLTASLYAVRT
jgi:FkbM family methyltransferase